MIKLMKADFLRLFKSILFWLAVIAVLVFAFFTVNENRYSLIGNTLDSDLFLGTAYIFFPIAIVISTLIGDDHRYGTIRNKISVGLTRTQIYFSNFIVCTAASLILHALWLIAIIVSSKSEAVSDLTMSERNLAILIFISFITIIAFTSLILLTSMVIPSIILSVIAAVVIVISMTYLSLWIDDRLSVPEYDYVPQVISMYTDDDGNLFEEHEYLEVKNPQYVSGIRRKVYTFLYCTLPSAQVRHLNDINEAQELGTMTEAEINELVDKETVISLYALLFICVTTVSGVVIFGKEDLK